MSFGRRKPIFWDSSDVLVEILSRALEQDGWIISTASSRSEKSYPTGDGRSVFPDVVAVGRQHCIFLEVKSRMFLLRHLKSEHIIYHFAPDPHCQTAYRALSLDPRDTGPCEMQRLVKACAAHSTAVHKQALATVVVPDYVSGWKLDVLETCLAEMNASCGIATELWILSRNETQMSLKKRLEMDSSMHIPLLSESIVSSVFQELIRS